MKIALGWLKEFVEVPVEPRRLKADLTSVGLNVESMTAAGDDWVLEVEVTTNRPDCLSHFGLAREVSTLYRKPLKRPETQLKEAGAPTERRISISIEDPDLCARYCGRVIENVRVKPSPAWLQKRLETVGQRPINNVADVTNCVLMELGHPLHAFDLTRLGQQKIIVRRARPGERLRTLDGVDRELARENLVIADGGRAVALAGVMGGEDSEISSSTHSVMLESAWFEPISIRRTAKAQGMRTEASHRFERGADVEMVPRALDRAAQLIVEVASGEVLKGIVDVFPAPPHRGQIVLRPHEIRRLLGSEAPVEEVERILCSLGFEIERQATDGWRVIPPSFRLDVTREVDLVEEVARHIGYDRLPARLRPAPPPVERDDARDKELTLTPVLVGLGYREIVTSSMVDPQENSVFTDRPPVLLANPLSQEASSLRSTTIPSMLRALRWNLDRDQGDIRLFELGKTYTARPKDLPEERRVLTLGLTGWRLPPSVRDREEPVGFLDLKGDLETVLEAFDVPNFCFESVPAPSTKESAIDRHYQPDATGRFVVDGQPLLIFGQLNRDVARDYKIRQEVWLAEVDLERLLGFPLRRWPFRPFSKFPAVERDFSLVVPDPVTYSRIQEALSALALPELRRFRPLDLFRGSAIGADRYSLLLRVTFQSQERTLTAEEIAEASDRLVRALKPLGIRLRS